jgi:hypothetical protein
MWESGSAASIFLISALGVGEGSTSQLLITEPLVAADGDSLDDVQ